MRAAALSRQSRAIVPYMPFAYFGTALRIFTILCARCFRRKFLNRLCNNSATGPNWKEVMAEHTDAWGRLLVAANAGDSRAYAQFLREVSVVLRGVIRAKAGGLGEAVCEDVLQEVLLAIHLKRHTWQPDAPVRPWVYAITRYKVVDVFRARGRRIDLPIEDFAEVLAAEAGPDPTEAADMAKMIGMLDGRAAEIVRKIGLEGASVAETGQALSMSEGAVRVALHRAFKALAILRERHVK
jgi:RNA polymerase sigma factor (sigma-70 family)